MLPKKLQDKIDARARDSSLRSLGFRQDLIDFSSNDYLGFSRSKEIYNKACSILKQHNYQANGATGSRLLTANHPLYLDTEKQIATFHKTPSALIFNSGYDANIGFYLKRARVAQQLFGDYNYHVDQLAALKGF